MLVYDTARNTALQTIIVNVGQCEIMRRDINAQNTGLRSFMFKASESHAVHAALAVTITGENE